jgi:hypothetical protein
MDFYSSQWAIGSISTHFEIHASSIPALFRASFAKSSTTATFPNTVFVEHSVLPRVQKPESNPVSLASSYMHCCVEPVSYYALQKKDILGFPETKSTRSGRSCAIARAYWYREPSSKALCAFAVFAPRPPWLGPTTVDASSASGNARDYSTLVNTQASRCGPNLPQQRRCRLRYTIVEQSCTY